MKNIYKNKTPKEHEQGNGNWFIVFTTIEIFQENI